jgi:type III pantothenate kinase
MRPLFIDIGNTNLGLGYLKALGKGMKIWKLRTSDLNDLKKLLRTLDYDLVMIASVVPELTSKVKRVLKRKSVEVIEVGKDIKVPMEILYKKPKKLGIDRLLNAFYVKEKIGTPAICVDVGTAITIDLISKRGKFLGGLIFPGFRLCSEALAKGTALLPKIDLKKYSKKKYGQDTQECIKVGLIEGISTLIIGVTKNLEKIFSNTPFKVLTGGDVSLLKKRLFKEFLYIPELTLRGMELLWAKMNENLQK